MRVIPPGGTTDVIPRLVAHSLGQKQGRSVVVKKRAGASGNIGAQLVSKAAPDGTTLLFVASSHAMNASLYRKLPFDVEKDFPAVGVVVATTPYVWVNHPQIPARTVPELIALLKSQSARFQHATASQARGNTPRLNCSIKWQTST